jgi:LemA protein
MGVILSSVFLFVVAGALIYLATLYNGLIALRSDIDKAWANIDVLLKQRYDEIPRVVEVCKGYMQRERDTLQSIAQARSTYAQAVTVNQKAEASGPLTSSVRQLFADAESYPELKANATFLQLQKCITDLEDQIADRREFYNDAVNTFNIRTQEMPDAFVAKLMRLKPREMFKVKEAERTPVRVMWDEVLR